MGLKRVILLPSESMPPVGLCFEVTHNATSCHEVARVTKANCNFGAAKFVMDPI